VIDAYFRNNVQGWPWPTRLLPIFGFTEPWPPGIAKLEFEQNSARYCFRISAIRPPACGENTQHPNLQNSWQPPIQVQ
jgi:hypothetical protein